MIRIEATDDNRFRTTHVTHGDQRLSFITGTFDKAGVNNPQRSLEILNEYYATLEPERITDLFAVYQRARTIFDETKNRQRIQDGIKKCVAELYQIIDIPAMLEWAKYRQNVYYPENVRGDYSEDIGPRDLTYVKEEYAELAYFSILLKVMLPIAGEYISRWKNISGNGFKEYQALTLLPKPLIARPEFQRLVVYVKKNSAYFNNNNSAYHGGLGEAELPDWLLALGLYRRVMLFDIRDPDEHLVKRVFSFLKNKMNDRDKTFARHNDRGNISSSGLEEDNISIIENQRSVEPGDVTVAPLVSEYLETYWMQIAERLRPGINPQLVSDCINFTTKSNIVFRDIHNRLCSLLLEELIPSSSLYDINNIAKTNAVGICQAIFYDMGLTFAAELCTAKYSLKKVKEGTFMMSDGPGLSRIKRDKIEALSAIYIHNRRTKRSEPTPRQNVGVEWVDAFISELESYTIRYHRPLVDEGQPKNDSNMILPMDSRSLLADTLITLFSKPKAQDIPLV